MLHQSSEWEKPSFPTWKKSVYDLFSFLIEHCKKTQLFQPLSIALFSLFRHIPDVFNSILFLPSVKSGYKVRTQTFSLISNFVKIRWLINKI